MKTEKIVITRDIVWLNRSWGNWKNVKDIDIEDELIDDERKHGRTIDPTVTSIDDSSIEESNTDSTTTTTAADIPPQPGTRQFRMLRQLHTHYNPTMDNVQQQLEEEKSEADNEEILEQETAEIALVSTMSGGRDPLTFDEAWNHPDPIERQLWKEAIEKEFGDMKKRNAWKIISKEKVPLN